MSDYSNVYCVSSPLQILTACEALRVFEADVNVLVLREVSASRASHREQVESLIDIGAWSSILRWPSYGSSGALGLWRNARHARHIASKVGRHCQYYFMGGFGQLRNHLLRNELSVEKTVLLDDGTATLGVVDKYLSKSRFVPDFLEAMLTQGAVRSRVYSALMGLKKSDLDEPVSLFTGFNVPDGAAPGITVRRHRFEALKRQSMAKQFDDRLVFYFGSPLAEVGILSFADEIKVIKRVFEQYRQADVRFCYVTHRDDSLQKMTELRTMGIDVRSLGMPAELYFAKETSLPRHVASAVSTALFNVCCIVDGLRAKAFPVAALVSDERKERHHRLSNAYAGIGIEIVDLFEGPSRGSAVVSVLG